MLRNCLAHSKSVVMVKTHLLYHFLPFKSHKNKGDSSDFYESSPSEKVLAFFSCYFSVFLKLCFYLSKFLFLKECIVKMIVECVAYFSC